MNKLALFLPLVGMMPGPPPGALPRDVAVSSSAFTAGSPMPVDNTCDGADESPPLSWTSLPETTKSVAIIFEEPATTFTQWLLYDVSPDTHSLARASTLGTAATNDFDQAGYSGPCPTSEGLHQYRFIVYGLDVRLTIDTTDKRERFDQAMNGHVVARGQLLATYYR
jgi:Raf kinase inhibitor-like YbhB/YbcL family protein